MSDQSLDAEQTIVADYLASLSLRLTQCHRNNRWHWLLPWRARRQSDNTSQGCYIWGAVGRGKTMLMDRFFNELKLKTKKRVHFHQFMRNVHSALAAQNKQSDPLKGVASQLVDQARVLCIDEFMVHDIADAMILAELFTAFFENGVAIVTTSNSPPDELYKNGLQRARFLPAIATIKRNMKVMKLAGEHDYRLQWLSSTHAYHTPSDHKATDALASFFGEKTPTNQIIIELNHRPMTAIRHGTGKIWLSFNELCKKPRSADDYMDLACEYVTVLISDVPIMTSQHDDAARRFVNLIDTLYDHRCNLVIAAAAPANSLYQGNRLKADFQRTTSRLQEMTTAAYWRQQHRVN
ncbi:MAG: cell division protein ZapE [Gammaproteobacteria bacterium]|nr:cell division protein ZapE [Gammaproteobacteria bacterium]